MTQPVFTEFREVAGPEVQKPSSGAEHDLGEIGLNKIGSMPVPRLLLSMAVNALILAFPCRRGTWSCMLQSCASLRWGQHLSCRLNSYQARGSNAYPLAC